MRPVFAILVLAILAGLTPAASASAPPTRTYAFTDTTTQVGGVTFFTLADSPHGIAIPLPPGASVTWILPIPLAAAVAFGPQDAFSPSLSLGLAHGLINVQWGYVTPDGLFHALHISPNVPVTATTRSVAGQQVPAITSGSPKSTVVNAGLAETTLTGFSGTIPKGAHPAIQLQSNAVNTLLPGPSFLGANQASTATVPLPELPAGILLALGGAAIGGVLLVRTRKGWM